VREEGLEARWARHAEAHERLRRALGVLGCSRLAPDGEQLHPLLAVTPPDGVDEAAVRKALLTEHGIEISGGLGPLAGRLWRIGVMGVGAERDAQERLVRALAAELGATPTRPWRAVIDAAAFARLLTGYCLEVEAKQQIVVRSTTLAAPLLLELQRAILEADAWPLLRVEIPGATAAYYEHARDVHLDGYAPLAMDEAKKATASLAIQAPENTRALVGIDPERLARSARGRQPVRQAALDRRWCLTVWPTEALAQEAGVSLAAFERIVESALFLDRPDPVAAWGELRRSRPR
jgi:hypothetical protein